MEKRIVTEYSPQDLKLLVKEAIIEVEKEKKNEGQLTNAFSFNQVSKMLHVSHSTVKKLVIEGVLKTTSDQRRIPAWAVDEYLQAKK